MSLTRVFNLATREELFYYCAPFSAVVAAFAQVECKDWNTWDYHKYWIGVDYTRFTFIIGDWCAMNDNTGSALP